MLVKPAGRRADSPCGGAKSCGRRPLSAAVAALRWIAGTCRAGACRRPVSA